MLWVRPAAVSPDALTTLFRSVGLPYALGEARGSLARCLDGSDERKVDESTVVDLNVVRRGIGDADDGNGQAVPRAELGGRGRRGHHGIAPGWGGVQTCAL